jgi:hypothetical protein
MNDLSVQVDIGTDRYMVPSQSAATGCNRRVVTITRDYVIGQQEHNKRKKFGKRIYHVTFPN